MKVFSVMLCRRKNLSFNHKIKHVQTTEYMQEWLDRPHFCNMFMKDGLIRLILWPMKKTLRIISSCGDIASNISFYFFKVLPSYKIRKHFWLKPRTSVKLQGIKIVFIFNLPELYYEEHLHYAYR